MSNIILRPYTASDRQCLVDMMLEYFNSDLGEKLSRERMSIIITVIEHEMTLFPLHLSVLEHTGEPVGFIIFQIDTPENSWGLKPGWGFIRELYVKKELRRNGLGSAMTKESLRFLKTTGVNMAYLTAAEDAKGFWQGLGFADSEEICEKNGLRIYSREL